MNSKSQQRDFICSGVLLDCGCNVVNRLGQLVGEKQRNLV